MKTFAHRFAHAWLLDGVRTPMVDYCGAFGDISPTDMGIKVARAVIERAGVAASDVDSVITGSMAQADFDAYMLPRHIGLYAGVPLSTPAILVQRICGTGFELLRQAADQIALGYADLALVVGAESMTRNPIAAYNHRTGFKLGAPVGFKDFLMEALIDTAVPVTMIETAENLARLYGISRDDVDRYACRSFELALKAQADGFLAGEIVPVQSETFALAGYHPRGIRLPRKVAQVEQDTHPRPSPVDALAQLRTVYEGGVQTAGNSSALVDGAGAGGQRRLRAAPCPQAAGAAGGCRRRGGGARNHGHRPGPGHSCLARALRAVPKRHRLVRDQRGPRRTDHCGGARAGAGSQPAQCQRGRHCPGPSTGGNRVAPDDYPGARAQAPWFALWGGLCLCGRRPRDGPACGSLIATFTMFRRQT